MGCEVGIALFIFFVATMAKKRVHDQEDADKDNEHGCSRQKTHVVDDDHSHHVPLTQADQLGDSRPTHSNEDDQRSFQDTTLQGDQRVAKDSRSGTTLPLLHDQGNDDDELKTNALPEKRPVPPDDNSDISARKRKHRRSLFPIVVALFTIAVAIFLAASVYLAFSENGLLKKGQNSPSNYCPVYTTASETNGELSTCRWPR